MRRQEKVAEALSVQSMSVTFIGKAVGPSTTTRGLTQGSRLRPQLLPRLGLTPLPSENAQGDAEAWVCISKQDLRSAQPW